MPMSPYDLDEVTNLVQRDGISARLSEQEKRLFILLAARAGTALGKRVLMEALWGSRAQWMEDTALVQLVSRLRRSLAPLGLQRAVVTVARVGYRLDLPAPAAPTENAANGTTHRSRTRESAYPHAVPMSLERSRTEALTVRDATDAPSHAALPHQGVARDGHGEVRRNGVVVRIPQIEYRLLCALRSPAGVVHDKRTLIALLWPERPAQDDTNLMQVVSRLRRKLIPLDLHRHIVTVPRIGYRFEPCDTPMPNPRTPAHAPRMPRALAWLSTTLPRALVTLTRHLRWPGR
ncbi:winged helix-turn-helix domain-containing protein [Pandoraea apista]|uniref:winged helix-turn-helix domain-containing protein n=1 Tax=Pandoraea apista TaxID=93218 RepID=UPI00069CB030|nr:winged helix-turn-helix domain-containing protein [Pandoraea apista]